MLKRILVIGVLIVGHLGSLSHAIEPANPDLIPRGAGRVGLPCFDGGQGHAWWRFRK